MIENLKDKHIILASQSPRRRHLLHQAGIEFTAMSSGAEETYPEGLTPDEIALFLARKKADHFNTYLEDEKNIVITADTLVILDGHIIGKPDDYDGAVEMLRRLSGRVHQVVTGVAIRSKQKSVAFTDWTEVSFKELTEAEIRFYLDNYKPYDKAGSYGIQEWIGYIGVTSVKGSFFNVMGFPIHRVYAELHNF
jgi:septum formation protein